MYDEDDATVFRDMIMIALMGFVAIVILILLHINPPKTSAEADIRSPGNVIVEMRWPDGSLADVDLWVQAPGDIPVGFSNLGGAAFNLLRDDLGAYRDLTSFNFETAFTRGLIPGEYTVNAHLYSLHGAALPILVEFVISRKRNDRSGAQVLIRTEMDLRMLGEERTAIRFRLDEEGNLLPGSVNNIPRRLRSARTRYPLGWDGEP